MRSVFEIVALVFVVCGFAFGQTPNCPKISLDTYGGVAMPGEKIPFKVTVGTTVDHSKLEYVWTLDKGTILSGQNTGAIVVKLPEDDPYSIKVNTTVTISGLPEGCTNSFSDLFAVVIEPNATKLDEFSGPLSKISQQRIKKIIDAIKADENSQLFVFIYGSERNRKRSFNQKRAFIIDQMKRAGVDPTRVTFEFSESGTENVIIWHVPPGVRNPLP